MFYDNKSKLFFMDIVGVVCWFLFFKEGDWSLTLFGSRGNFNPKISISVGFFPNINNIKTKNNNPTQ